MLLSVHQAPLLQTSCRRATRCSRAALRVRAGAAQTPSRRELLSGVGGALVLLSQPVAASPLDGLGKRVLLTGANTGIGRDAAAKLAARGYDVTLACRTLAKAQAAATEITEAAAAAQSPLAGSLRGVECDLASLASVRACAGQAGSAPLHLLLLNAGVQFSGDDTVRRTQDGFELTVGTNHLGHYLLANLLLPQLDKAGPGARIVVTASEVHDPSSPGGSVGPGASLGSLAGLRSASFVMVDGSAAFNADKAYKDSKLCNVLFTREMARRLRERGSPVTCNTFSPGLITRTDFFRNQNPLFVGVFDFFTNEVFHVAESVSGGGDCLVSMATEAELEGRSGLYYNNDLAPGGKHLFHEDEVSDEARREEEGRTLWDLSAKLVGLPA